MGNKTQTKRNRDRIMVPNGCSFTEPYITPDNWPTKKASVRQKWFLRFTYYDPVRRPDGKQIKWEKTLNNFKTLPERQNEARRVLDEALRDLHEGINPVIGNSLGVPISVNLSGEMDLVERPHEFLTPKIPFKKAIQWAFDQFPENRTKSDIKIACNHIIPAMTIIGYEKLPIRDISPQHIVFLLSACAKVTFRYDPKRKQQVPLSWSDYKHNKCLAYLSMMLNKVVELRVIPVNPCHGLRKKTCEVKKRVALLPHEVAAVDQKLMIKPDFRRFVMMFHASGSRITELMKLQAKDVIVDQYCFYRWVLKKKTQKISQVRTTIPASVIHLWREQMAMCKSQDDFLFYRGFRPGKKPIGVQMVNKYWRRLVQSPLGIAQGPYVLKHMFLTQLKKQYGSGTAAAHAAHESTAMVDNVYDLDREQSDHERIKSADISFVPRQLLRSADKCLPMSFNF